MAETTENTGALSGIRVIDLSRVLGGPFSTQILGDHGADVIKVEPPMGDETREYGPPFETDAEGKTASSAYFKGVNRNKRGIALDLGTEGGRAVALRLLEGADVLVENFKIGTMERWGLGYEDVLRERFPRLIYLRITGFGADGPLGGFPGYDAVAQAMSGLMSVNGTAASGPVRMGAPIVDLVAGLNAVIGITMALVERQRSGAGQFIESALYDAGISLLQPHAVAWLMAQRLPVLGGSAHPSVAPYDLFGTRTRPVFIAAANNGTFRRLMEVLGRPDVADDERFASNGQRTRNYDALAGILVPLLADWDCDELCRHLVAANVAAGPLNNVQEVMEHPHTRHRGMVVEKDGFTGVGPPLKMSRTPPSVRRAPPAFSADSRAVLAEAGYGEDEIEALIAAGAVVSERRRG